MRIDVHWHHVPRLFVDSVLDGTLPLAGKVEREGDEANVVLENGFSYRLSSTSKSSDPSQAVAHMDEIGLDVIAPSISPPLMHHTADAATATRISQVINDGFSEVEASFKGRFRPLANLPMQDPKAAAAELKRAVEELGFPGAQSVPMWGVGIREKMTSGRFGGPSRNWTPSSSSTRSRPPLDRRTA